MRKTLLLITSLILVVAAWTSSARAADAGTLNLRDFGAVGDGETDDGPALQRALDALAEGGGGTLFVPEGLYVIATPVAKDFTGYASSITILGVESPETVNYEAYMGSTLELPSAFAPRTISQNAVSISGLETFLIQDIMFLGTPDVPTDALVTLDLNRIEHATIRHCEFYGLASQQVYGSIVSAIQSRLTIDQTKFLGSTGASGLYVPVVRNQQWKGITVTDTVFVDYGSRPGFLSKTGYGAPISWLLIGDAEATGSEEPRREVEIRNVFMDEGAYIGILCFPLLYDPASAPIDLVYISNFRMNVANLGEFGMRFNHARAVLIENAHYQWGSSSAGAIVFNPVGTAILDQVECLASAYRVKANAPTAKLFVINSVGVEPDSQAQTTEVINTTTPEEDPVQYVRQQYELIVNRAPDPAGHFYWSNLILLCGQDAQCVDGGRAALDTYLGTAPAPSFSITGRVTDENGNVNLADVSVTLSGSQSAQTQTDANGQYRFSDLPTSGIYSVTVAKPHHTFSPGDTSFTTPSGDQVANFAWTLNEYTIGGRLVDANDQGLPGITVNLAGVESATTTTDNGGYFSFAGLAAQGDYTVTPLHEHYSFQPASRTFDDLGGNQTSDFAGTLNTHTISGQVTKADGTELSGVAVALSGSQTETATTNSNGDYSFPGLAAGGSYTVATTKTHYTFQPPSRTFNDLSGNQTSGFVGTLNTHTISGRVTRSDGSGISGVSVSLSGTQTGATTTNSNGNYSFAGCAAGGNYTIAVSKVHYSFSSESTTLDDLAADQAANFTGELLSYEISGQVTLNGAALAGVTLSLTGSQSAAATGGTDGAYSFMLPAEGSYTVTPSKTNYTFSPPTIVVSNLSSDAVGNFTAVLNPGVPVLVSEADSTRAIVIDSVLNTGEPFQLSYAHPWMPDRRTRITLFATNFELLPNETVAVVTAEAEDGSHAVYPMTVEYVGKVPGLDWLNCIVIRLNDNLGDVGDVLVRVTYRGISSNRVRVGIGHSGGGLPDDVGAVPTPGQAPQ